MIIRSLIVFIVLVGAVFVMGVLGANNVAQLLPGISMNQSQAVRCADEVSTKGWKIFTSNALAFSVSYPSSFVVDQHGDSVTFSDGSGETIAMQKLHQSLGSLLDPSMEQGSWKVADRRTYALTTPYVTNDDGTLTSTYIFVRDFPQQGTNGDYAEVRAVITLKDADALKMAAQSAKVLDPETILNSPEQILSTFRFLEFDELTPKSSGE